MPTAKKVHAETGAIPLIKRTLADVVVALELTDGPAPERRQVLAAAIRSAGRLLKLRARNGKSFLSAADPLLLELRGRFIQSVSHRRPCCICARLHLLPRRFTSHA